MERIDLYEEIVGRIHKAVTLYYLTDPEKFETEDEKRRLLQCQQAGYWHEHVDSDQYGTFALLYLNSQMRDPTYDVPESGAKGADALNQRWSLKMQERE